MKITIPEREAEWRNVSVRHASMVIRLFPLFSAKDLKVYNSVIINFFDLLKLFHPSHAQKMI